MKTEIKIGEKSKCVSDCKKENYFRVIFFLTRISKRNTEAVLEILSLHLRRVLRRDFPSCFA